MKNPDTICSFDQPKQKDPSLLSPESLSSHTACLEEEVYPCYVGDIFGCPRDTKNCQPISKEFQSDKRRNYRAVGKLVRGRQTVKTKPDEEAEIKI